MKLHSPALNDAIGRLKVGQLFSVIGKDDAHRDCWERVARGYRCLADSDGEQGAPVTYQLNDSWGRDAFEFRAYDMDESARILAILALTGKLPWVG